ncbi:MAG: transpeptidase family protein [Muribaculaceae bacterium]|nr:transpeptidase family protein [Muribaculaceae bacterium]
MRKDSKRRIYWRYLLVLVLVVLLAVRIIWKEVKTTVVDADKWNAQMEAFLGRSLTVPPERGDIISADGKVLATNMTYYDIRLDYRSERFNEKMLNDSIDRLSDSLATYYPKRTAAEWKEHLLRPLETPKKNRPRAYLVLKNLNIDQCEHVRSFPFFNQKNKNRSGFTTDAHTKRCYPYGKMAKRSIGHVNESRPFEIHGFSGIEASLDSLLFGTPGHTRKTPMLTGIYNEVDVKPIRGFDVVTTIDIDMQEIVENELNAMLDSADAEWGVAVLMEVATGDIKAISNLEKERIETDTATHAFRYTGRIVEGMNRAVMGFEPGSVVKPISMLIALESGAVTSPNQMITIGDHFAYAGGKPIRDSHYNSALTAEGVIEQSSNIGMARIITGKFHNNPQAFRKALEERGFFEPMKTGIAGERVPRFADLTSHGARLNLSRICFGYASEIPPIYTLSIYNAIANNGRYVRPHLVNRIIGNNIDSTLVITPIRERICTEKNAKILQNMLKKVVWGDHGTARRLKDDQVALAGKTGTCRIIDEKSGQYIAAHRFAFCGYFPADNPQYSCIVLVSHPRKGALSAPATSGQTMLRIAHKMFSRGMLNNYSDYKTSPAAAADLIPNLTASLSEGQTNSIKQITGVKNVRPARIPVTSPTDSVPNVVGMDLRKAVTILEGKGFSVSFKGTGYVASQTREGKKVRLTLKF